MTKQYPIALHIFRRDFRLFDNTALIEALKSSRAVIPCFIFDERQIKNNVYKSNNCIQFMVSSLQALNTELNKKKSRLYLFYGTAENIVSQLLAQYNIKAVYTNRDYTPFSQERDKKIAKICQELNVDFYSYADLLLHEPEEVMKLNAEPYTIFSHFFKKSFQLAVSSPKVNSYDNFYQKPILLENNEILEKLLKINNPTILLKGGRSEALSLLKKVKQLEEYHIKRNFPALSYITHLSPHNKFGTLSIRELYTEIIKNFDKTHGLINELYWRDFFTHIAFHFPRIFGEAFHKKYDAIHWSKNQNFFKRWCAGKTGFPIVDAGMRELNLTGYMHNRVRMITASFLIKDLHIDWRFGEKYFAQKLIDYDPAVNNGNWQWVASTGCDAQPYFRIFNPWLQQQKFDKDCIYIKKWIPELATIPPKTLHNLHAIKIKLADYPKPMVDHTTASQKARIIYQQC